MVNGYKEYLEIKSNKGDTDKFNGQNLRLYSFTITEELLGKKSLTAELSLPIYYEDNNETFYPFDRSFCVEYNNDTYYLNTNRPPARKTADNAFYIYTLVFESVCTKSLDSVYIKNVGYCYRDSDDDGWADTNEAIEEIQVFAEPAFYGNLFEYAEYIRQNLDYTFGYHTDANGNIVSLVRQGGNQRIPRFVIRFGKISNATETIVNSDPDSIGNSSLEILKFWEFQNEETLYKAELTTNNRIDDYGLSKRKSIELKNTTILGALQKINETFTYKVKDLQSAKYDEEIGYNFIFESIKIPRYFTDKGIDVSIAMITIDPQQEVVKHRVGEREVPYVFEYGGTASYDNDGAWLMEITRTSNDDNYPTRIYGVGGSDNLPPNYLRLVESTVDEVHNDKTIYMPYKSREDLINQHKADVPQVVGENNVTTVEDIVADNTKTYLVEREDFPDVFDKYIYIADGKYEFAQVEFAKNKVTAFKDRSNVVFGVVDGVGNLPEIGNNSYKQLSNKLYLFRDTTSTDGKDIYAYYYNPYSSGTPYGSWINALGGNNKWSSNGDGIDLLLNNIPANFMETGKFIKTGNIFIVNNSDKGYDDMEKAYTDIQNAYSNLNIDDALFFAIKATKYTETGDVTYTGRFIKLNAQHGFYNTEMTTYERLNPFPKYYSFFKNLMPDVVRAYFAGWRYADIYLSRLGEYITADEYVEVQNNLNPNMFVRNFSTDRYTHPKFLLIDDVFKKLYLPVYEEEQEDYEIFLGLFDWTFSDDDYKPINAAFRRGMMDFVYVDGAELLGLNRENIYVLPTNQGGVKFEQLGKIWRPIDYVDAADITENGVIEKAETYDIKPSLVDCWVEGLGRLDEVIDVYVPNPNDEDKLGKYWEDDKKVNITSIQGMLGVSLYVEEEGRYEVRGTDNNIIGNGNFAIYNDFIEVLDNSNNVSATYLIAESQQETIHLRNATIKFGEQRLIPMLNVDNRASTQTITYSQNTILPRWFFDTNNRLENTCTADKVNNLTYDVKNANVRIHSSDIIEGIVTDTISVSCFRQGIIGLTINTLSVGTKIRICRVNRTDQTLWASESQIRLTPAAVGYITRENIVSHLLPMPETFENVTRRISLVDTSHTIFHFDLSSFVTNGIHNYEYKRFLLNFNADVIVNSLYQLGTLKSLTVSYDLLVFDQIKPILSKVVDVTLNNIKNCLKVTSDTEDEVYIFDKCWSNKLNYKLRIADLGFCYMSKYSNYSVGYYCCIYFSVTSKEQRKGVFGYKILNSNTGHPLNINESCRDICPEYYDFYINVKDKTYNYSSVMTFENGNIKSSDSGFEISSNTNLQNADVTIKTCQDWDGWDVYTAAHRNDTGLPLFDVDTDITFSFNEVSFDFTTREFFVWVKDLHFNPMLPAFQGDNAPDLVFSNGQVAGLDCKFQISTAHCDGVVEDTSRTMTTQLDKDDPSQRGEVQSKYMIALEMIENRADDKEKSLFKFLPAGEVKPKQGDLFILENVIYPHNPYVYKAEMELRKKMELALKESKRYSYAITLDYIAIDRLGIDFNQIKIGNKIRIRNKTMLNSEYVEFTIKSVTITRDEESIYDKYQIILDQDMRYLDDDYKAVVTTDEDAIDLIANGWDEDKKWVNEKHWKN